MLMAHGPQALVCTLSQKGLRLSSFFLPPTLILYSQWLEWTCSDFLFPRELSLRVLLASPSLTLETLW